MNVTNAEAQDLETPDVKHRNIKHIVKKERHYWTTRKDIFFLSKFSLGQIVNLH